MHAKKKTIQYFETLFQIEGTQGDTGDDTSLNGIRLLCGEGLENSGESKAVSGEAPWGTWGTEARCIDGHFITSFKLQVESEQVMLYMLYS